MSQLAIYDIKERRSIALNVNPPTYISELPRGALEFFIREAEKKDTTDHLSGIEHRALAEANRARRMMI